MTDEARSARHVPDDTVWVERDPFIDRVPRPVAMAFVLFVILGIWWGLTASGLVSPIVLPTPMETYEDLIFVGNNMLDGGYVLEALWTTTRTILYAFALSTALGFTLGALVGETKFGERALMPYLVAIDTMPKVAFAPLFIAWLGFDIASKVALATFMATFPIVVATASGLHAASENERMLFRAVGATRLQTLVQLKIPNGLPYFFTGLKIASVAVMAGAITGEFLGGGEGMGGLIRVAASQLNTPRVFSLIIYLSFLGLALYLMVAWTQRKVVFWSRSSVAGTLQ